MYRIKHITSSILKLKRSWRHFLWDTLLAVGGTIVLTLVLHGLHLYPLIPNISLVYLLVVLTLASTRGLYSAILSSVAAFLSFDFFLVQPLYTFTITRPEEWLALSIFLSTAILTGQLAAALRVRAEQAWQREQETRILYELLRDTNAEKDLDSQLNRIARKVVEIFGARGVRDCTILLSDEKDRPEPRTSICCAVGRLSLTPDELSAVAWVMREGQSVDVYNLAHLPSKARSHAPLIVVRSTAMPQAPRRYLSLFPLKVGQKIGGVLCLLMEENLSRFSGERRLGSEADHSDPRTTFFQAFLDQAAAMIENARLRRESLQVEVLQRTDALRAALISSVSHDLRTPLTSIKAAASSLLQDDVQWGDEARHRFAQAIEHEADRLNRLVENLLDLSRIEGGALKPEKEWYPIEELLHDVLDRMQLFLRGREVKADLPADLPPVELDYLMIDQVLTNLIENSLRYTPARSPLEITVTARATELVLSIADRGPGIPISDLERIFDKFYRVSGRASETGGTGVGLAVCRGLIEAHGGRIWAENRRDGGAIFRCTLPLSQAEKKQATLEESQV